MLRRLFLGATCAVGMISNAQAQSDLAGPYLAARIAGFSSDFSQAARYYDKLIEGGMHTAAVAESAMVVFSVLGDFDRAAAVAQLDSTSNQNLAKLVTLIHALSAGEIEEAREQLQSGPVTGPLLDGLLKAWVEIRLGRMGVAFEALDALADRQEFEEFAHIHRAFALAIAGDFEGAEAIFAGETYGPLRLGPRGIAAHAEALVQLGRNEEALALLDTGITGTGSADLKALRATIAAGELPRYATVSSPESGMAEALYTFAAVVNGEFSDSLTLIHARAAMVLDPRNADAALLTAGLLNGLEQYELANEALAAVPDDHPASVDIEITRADVLIASGKQDAALDVLEALAQRHPEHETVLAALGDLNRQLSNYEAALSAYDRAVTLAGPPEEQRDWFLYFVRGISHERTGDWVGAAADFEQALAVNPGQAQVLNYYGYSLVERRERLDEALEMIELAVENRVDSGFITDSLGWVLYRLGRYDEAVEPMERAVKLEPLDPVINDHLGDVYWKVGRTREAEFQWSRALSFVPEPNDSEADPDRIRRKLEVGLDAVLAQEVEDEASE